jgi:zinc transport system permease protein
MGEILSMGFMRNALAAALLVSVACGVIGSLVVVRRIVFISGGIAHAAYGGVGLGYWLQYGVLAGAAGTIPGVWPVAGALVFALAAAVIMGVITRRGRQRSDTVIGVLWAVGMALGVMFTDITPGYKANLMSYLFGSVLAVSQWEIAAMAVMDLLVLAGVLLFFRPLQAVSFDETFAETRGLPVGALHMITLCMVALSVVMMMRVVGLIMVIALLTIPAAISGMFNRRLSGMMIWAVVLGALFSGAGLAAAWFWNVSSGAAVILTAGIFYFLALAGRRLLERRA